ncbi:hypothetical protein DNK49_12605 [Azoarcus communis]|uniref:Glycosyltransferase 2-like domain-containing protein n=1 Tax=Parazoarcus communis SWub3 = DSM 12120 TaxID=1121029 RepID=A0A323UUN2_9RHOO|nr:glycosyltransferase [Parazoarcus communis SWub3 = DSM 12120]PZA16155.1 hypothetical protein DNK49_12605 [Azoarcus communis] [Parazoarcus communis SWub3 = DSM 12120]
MRCQPSARDVRNDIDSYRMPISTDSNAAVRSPRALFRYVQRLRKVVAHLWPVAVHAVCHPVWAFGACGRALRLMRAGGIGALRNRVLLRESVVSSRPEEHTYARWIESFDTLDDADRARMRRQIEAFAHKPLVSVLMPVYNPPADLLDAAIRSVRSQIYPHWELCVADDASTDPEVKAVLLRHSAEDERIRVTFRDRNGHISQASNTALEQVQGEFVALLDHDDLLAEHALFHVAAALDCNPDAGLIYSDEDKLDAEGQRYDPYFKCQYNIELMLAQNMICHLGVYRTALVRELGGFRTGFEGAQDYDLALRVIECLRPAQIVHIPRVLYHWRAIEGSTALDAGEKDYASSAGVRAVQSHLDRTGVRARVVPAPEVPVLNRVIFECPAPAPRVSILIPTRDRADLLEMCVRSLLERSTYANFEIIIIDNGSTEPETFALFEQLPSDRVRILRDEAPFNFSRLNNAGAAIAQGELLCLMNNDIEVLTPGWLEEMVSFATQPGVGCVGARLWYPDGRLQHGGVIIGLGGVAGHSHKYFPKGHPGYFHRAVLHQRLSAVTAACLVIRKAVYEQVGGLDESLAVAFNDVDFCLRVQAAGYRNVWTPYAEMNHHESASRGYEDNPEKQARFAGEVACIQARWGRSLLEDVAYSPNLTLATEDFAMAWPPRVANNEEFAAARVKTIE